MDYQKTLYPGIWSMIFMIFGLQIWIIKLVGGYADSTLLYAYYGCSVAALIAFCFLIINVAKVITEKQ